MARACREITCWRFRKHRVRSMEALKNLLFVRLVSVLFSSPFLYILQIKYSNSCTSRTLMNQKRCCGYRISNYTYRSVWVISLLLWLVSFFLLLLPFLFFFFFYSFVINLYRVMTNSLYSKAAGSIQRIHLCALTWDYSSITLFQQLFWDRLDCLELKCEQAAVAAV
jgi:hypothetical protein